MPVVCRINGLIPDKPTLPTWKNESDTINKKRRSCPSGQERLIVSSDPSAALSGGIRTETIVRRSNLLHNAWRVWTNANPGLDLTEIRAVRRAHADLGILVGALIRKGPDECVAIGEGNDSRVDVHVARHIRPTLRWVVVHHERVDFVAARIEFLDEHESRVRLS